MACGSHLVTSGFEMSSGALNIKLFEALVGLFKQTDHFFEELLLWNQRETLICGLEVNTLGHFLLQM